MKFGKKIKTTILLPPDLDKRAKQEAKKRDISFNVLVEEALEGNPALPTQIVRFEQKLDAILDLLENSQGSAVDENGKKRKRKN